MSRIHFLSGRRLLSACLVVFGVAVLYTAYWYAAAYQLRTFLNSWTTEQLWSGLRVDLGQPKINGFPGWLRVRVARPEAATVEASHSWRWQGAAIEARSRPWRPDSIAFDGKGLHLITIGEPAAPQIFTIDAEGLSGRIVVGDGKVRSLGLDLKALTITTENLKDNLTLADAVLNFNSPNAPGLGFELDMRGLKLPKLAATPLGNEFTTIMLLGYVNGLKVDEDWPEVIASWRDGGGVIEVTEVKVRHGPLNVSGNGTIAFDAAMQPVAAFTVRAEGYTKTVDALHKAGLIKTGNVNGFKLVLGVLAKRRGGGEPYIEAPLTIQDSKLRIGPLDLLKFPVFNWGG